MTKLEKDMFILSTFGIAFVLIILTGMFSTHITISGNYKSYKETYNAIWTGDYIKESKFGDFMYFKKADGSSNKEIIKFPDGSIKLLNNDYLHIDSFVTWFSPYSLYYAIKFKKLFKKMETQEETAEYYDAIQERARIAYNQLRESRMRDIERDHTMEWDVPVREPIPKPKEFKFLRGSR